MEQQLDDGTWRDFVTLAGESVDWTTAYAAFHLAGLSVAYEARGRALDVLGSRQRPDGGWGFHRDVPTDADSTAFALASLSKSPNVPRSAIEQGIACLLSHRCPDGGFATYRHPLDIGRFLKFGAHVSLRGWCQSCPEVTAAVGIALMQLGSGQLPAATAAWNYLVSAQCADGSWPNYWWASAHYATSLSIVFGAELQSAGVEVGPTLDRGIAWIKHQAPRAETAFHRALTVAALARSAPRSIELEESVRELVRSQSADGGWTSEPILCIPWSARSKPDATTRWRLDELGVDVIVRDQNRSFTTATCVGALLLASEAA